MFYYDLLFASCGVQVAGFVLMHVFFFFIFVCFLCFHVEKLLVSVSGM
jgi:hypothetical protein